MVTRGTKSPLNFCMCIAERPKTVTVYSEGRGEKQGVLGRESERALRQAAQPRHRGQFLVAGKAANERAQTEPFVHTFAAAARGGTAAAPERRERLYAFRGSTGRGE
jgi:hypothetical protein